MPPIYLSVRHLQQQQDGECVAACAMMVLDYFNVQISYRRLLKLLEIQPGFGTPSYKIRNLIRLNISVEYGQGNLADLSQKLNQGQPCIVFVKTGELLYWEYNRDHAIVVTGIDDKYVYANDPDLPKGPVRITIGDFDLAWLERDEMYAVLTR